MDNPHKPRIFMAIGTEEFLYRNAQPLRQKLTKNGYDFTYQEESGNHNWGFWDAKIQDALKWMFDAR